MTGYSPIPRISENHEAISLNISRLNMSNGTNDIRYVCLSDMHLGAKGNLLTNVPPGSTQINLLRASPVHSNNAVA
jgi:hypothetical protein